MINDKDCFNPLPNDILDSSKLKELADDNFKFDENGRKLSKRVENTVGKGEVARFEQFLLFPQCFQKACFPGVSKDVIVWEWVKVWIQLFPIRQILDSSKLKELKFADDNFKFDEKSRFRFQIFIKQQIFYSSKLKEFAEDNFDFDENGRKFLKPVENNMEQEGHDGPVSLHWLIREIHSYQTLHYLGIGLKHKTPYKD